MARAGKKVGDPVGPARLRERKKPVPGGSAGGQVVAVISHEMREPLNGVLGLGRLLRDTPLDAEQQGYVVGILESAEALGGLVNDILDISRIEAGELQIQPVALSVRAFLERVAASLRPRAEAKGTRLVLEIEPSTPELVRGDPARLRQVLMNLLGNALKFTEAGTVRLAAAPGPASGDKIGLALTVEDTGPGIAPEALERLFRPYAQAGAETGRLYGGSGLGLVIARRIVDAMGGTLTCTSAPGSGTRFVVAVELGRPSATERRSAAEAPVLSGANLLIADPDERTRQTMVDLTRLWGMNVRTARTASESLALLAEAADRRNAFDMMLVDSLLADQPADELGVRIRAEPALAHTRLVMLAASGLRGDAARASKSGFAAYLPKPVTAATLLECLRTLRSGTERDELVTIHSMSEQRLPSLRALVVDDLPLNCKLLAVLLERAGHKVVSVGSGEAALAALESATFDVVLMDIQMPGMDGLEATRRIRGLHDRIRASVPVVAVTASAMRGDHERCMSAGMNGYLTKPIDGATLVSRVEGWARREASSSDLNLKLN